MQNTRSYIDLLLAEKQDGTLVLVVEDAHTVEVGHLIELDNGELARVIKKAWGGEKDGELHELIAAMVPIYEAKAAYWRSWKREADNGTVPGDS